MHFACSSYGSSTRFRQRDVTGLPLFNQARHTPNRFFDWHSRVNPRHTKDVKSIDAEALETFLAVLNQIVGLAAAWPPPTAVRRARATRFRVDYDSFAPPF